MKQQIEGLFLSAQNYTGSSVIVHLLQENMEGNHLSLKGLRKK